VPLSRQALAQLAAREQLGEFVFGRRGRSPFSGYSQAKERLDIAIAAARAKEAGHNPAKVELKEWLLPAWRLHDLRRTAVTHMVEALEIAPHVVEAAINHVSGHKGGVAGVYNRATYRPQKKAALQAWADHLEALVAGREPAGNVVAMRGVGFSAAQENVMHFGLTKLNT